tara:strand:- start:180 stop:413 length:234 start_codon:yes stop_codon:yes gene_type:complete
MEYNKLNKEQYEFINDDYIIYICKEKNPGTKYFLYFVDVFENKYNPYNEPYDVEVFNDISLAYEYIKVNYQMEVKND